MMVRRTLSAAALLLLTPALAFSQWQTARNKPEFTSSTALLLTDGSVIVQALDSAQWYRLRPDSSGDYVNGTWAALPPMPSGYGPMNYGSAVLADGRVIVVGGEYNLSVGSNTNQAAIYDPVANTWTSVSPPPGWAQIGTAPSAVLPNGHLLIGRAADGQVADLDPVTLTWTVGGSGKADVSDEEGWTLLRDGSILVVDAQNGAQSEKYLPWLGTWVSAGSTVVPLVTSGGYKVTPEMGPTILRPDGTVFAAGATGHTAIYTPPSDPTAPGTWVGGPDFPVVAGQQLDVADGPAAVLPDGNVLIVASPGMYGTGAHFFEFDGVALHEVATVPSAAGVTSSDGRMLLLPTGQVLFTGATGDVQIYTPTGTPNAAWAPTVTSVPRAVERGRTYRITGTQFNGLTQGVAYGDNAQAATNYPLVRITNRATGHVFYARTHGHSTMAVATGAAPVSTSFDVPAGIELGTSDVVVVANGIASSSVAVNVAPAHADFNADGHPDVVFRNYLTGENVLWFMSGASMAATAALPTQTTDWQLGGIGDFNGDGSPDLVWHNAATGANTLWYMSGTSLAGSATLPTMNNNNWRIVAVADFDGDGHPDLAWRNFITGENTIWLMDGTSIISQAAAPPLPDLHWQIVGAADFNGDGTADLVWRNFVTGLDSIWYMDGATMRSTAVLPAVGAPWQVLAVDDLDGDGSPDIVWRNDRTGDNVVWLLQGTAFKSTPSLPSVITAGWAAPQPASSQVPGDLNGDGYADLVWHNYGTGVNAIWYLNGTTLLGSTTLPSQNDPNWKLAGVADINGDGQPDLVWRNAFTGENNIWYLDGSFVMSTASLTPAGTHWEMAAVADFDGDGHPDLLWHNTVTGDNSMWLMNGATVQSYVSLWATGLAWEVAAAADLNRDGRADILFRNRHTGDDIVWFMNGGTVAGTAALPTVPDLTWDLVAAVDINGDGSPDLIWRNAANGRNLVTYMNGTTATGGGELLLVADSRWNVGRQVVRRASDFNGDHNADFIWHNTSNGTNGIWYMRGMTMLGTAGVPTQSDTTFRLVDAADMNGDGLTDLLWYQSTTGAVQVWYGPDFVTTASLPSQSNLAFQLVGVTDLNGDGVPELLWRNTSTGDNTVWFMNGPSVASTATVVAEPDVSWQLVATGDFNGDGETDLVWRKTSGSNAGMNVIWLMNGTSLAGTVTLDGVPNLDWHLVAAVDADGDGYTDLLWQNVSTGSVVVWYMNGVTVRGYGSIGGADPSVWQLVR